MEENLNEEIPQDTHSENHPLESAAENLTVETAENLTPEPTAPTPPPFPHRPAFYGEGSKFFVIQIVNFLLTVLTFGFYYPWAKASKLKYLYEQTEFIGSRFTFHGTGQEMFIGYLKALGLAIILYGGFYWMRVEGYFFTALIILYGGAILIYPIAIHGSIKYRFSRTSWRGIFFGYRGELSEMFYKCVVGGLLTIITLGVYSFWVRADVRRYVVDNLRLGDVEFEYRGQGVDLFAIAVKYYALMFAYYIVLALLAIIGALFVGISWNFSRQTAANGGSFASMMIGLFIAYIALIMGMFVIFLFRTREEFNYHVNKTIIWQNGQEHRAKIEASFRDTFDLVMVNFLLTFFTLGIGLAWVQIRTMHFIVENMKIEGTFNPDIITQTEDDFNDATGEDMADWMNIDLV